MNILIVYATTDGQTRKIARFAAHRFAEAGRSVELVNAEDTEGLDLSRFSGAVLAGSVHAGHIQKPLQDFAAANASALSAMHSLFLPVSLAAAGKDPEDWKSLSDTVSHFLAPTGWKPSRIEYVAGAFRFSNYDFFRGWVMRWIAASKDPSISPREDKEYTDWEALGRVLDDWAAGLSARKGAA